MSGRAPSNPRRAIFNALAPEWDSNCALKAAQAETLRETLERLAIPRGASVLDVGCGTGVLVPFLLPIIGDGGRYLGMDVSDGMIELARRKFTDPRVGFANEDIYEFEGGEAAYDLAIVFSAFPHLHDKPAALAAFARLTKPGGRLCIMHVESARAINAYHRERVANPVLSGDHLPSIDEMRTIVDPREWTVRDAEDREGLYLLLLERSNGLVL
jgi:ubiquinone/menaquinone biosynthesis C-methylase UbiE